MSHLSTATLGWIALGVVAALIAALILGSAFALRTVLRRRSALRAPSLAGPMPLPAEIIAAISAAPVLEQARAAGSYRGMPVRWLVTFESAFPSGLATLRLMCQDRGDYPWVLCDVRRGRFPQLRGLRQHAPLWVVGRVGSIKGDEIFLRGARLAFGD